MRTATVVLAVLSMVLGLLNVVVGYGKFRHGPALFCGLFGIGASSLAITLLVLS